MTLVEGETYRSPVYGRDINVLGIDKETPESYVLAILWVDRDYPNLTEPADLVVSKQDVQKWTLVTY